MNKEEKKEFEVPKFVALTLDEAIRLLVCVVLDVAEYAFPVLLTPVVGDILDIVGMGAGIMMFGWIGLLSLLEFLPMADIFPVFIFTWLVWYYLRKREEKERIERYKEKWK